ncbi:XisH family protein [Roseofilum sp. BLCC_M91]|uniref:XisH family protein n=1 Tax=Roseofilum halophilum BLCC-M91 TaxID=3022259 RepID=A0ABT7BJR3_9CYAN|nr:XisH family protein [Roseofilum halophilum]MDJ1179426.1 XisH family protein [Roseofilum halophilum BLCC-M91]
MPAKDLYHDNCKQALIKDGWKITHDPYPMRWGKKDLFIDLGAEKFLGAEKGDRRIAIEVKSFVGLSDIQDLKNALGQFILYQDLLARIEPERKLFLAIRDVVFSDLFEDSMSIGQVLLENRRFQLLVFNSEQEVIISWMS